MYEHVPRSRIIEALRHFRELLRQSEPTNEQERRAAEQREVVSKYLISNLPRTGDHPTLKSLMEVAETFRLTIGAAHQLFGYDLDALRKQDLLWNHGRTHIVESYIFDRDQLIDVPSELASEVAFESDAMVSDLVRRWRPCTIRALGDALSHRTGAFYVHVGTEDSETANLPAGSTALVDPVDQIEATRPNPKFIYLLQFGNGYRCSRCVITHGKLQLLTSPRKYIRARTFSCPTEVRVVGRVRMFAHALPQPLSSPGEDQGGVLECSDCKQFVSELHPRERRRVCLAVRDAGAGVLVPEAPGRRCKRKALTGGSSWPHPA